MKTIIAGSRTANLMQAIAGITSCPWRFEITCVLSGGARGIDEYGETWAQEMGITVDLYKARWATHGKAAGPIRNQEMADNAAGLIAVWDGKSKGTADMIRRAKAKGLRVHVFNYITGEVMP